MPVVMVYVYRFWRNSLLKYVSQPKIAKKIIKPLLLCSRSSKVNANRKSMNDFILVIFRILGPV